MILLDMSEGGCCRLSTTHPAVLPDPHEHGVYTFASALVGGVKPSDADFAEVEKAIGRNGIAEVLVLIGYYTSVALGMKVHEVPIPQQP